MIADAAAHAEKLKQQADDAVKNKDQELAAERRRNKKLMKQLAASKSELQQVRKVKMHQQVSSVQEETKQA